MISLFSLYPVIISFFSGVRLRSPKTMTPDEASDEVHKRESEIFQTIQEKREQLKREAEQESERQRLAWEEQGGWSL